MITDRDITTRVVAEAADPKTTSVGDVFSRDLVSVEPDDDLEEAVQLMASHQVRWLPVVEDGRLVGIVVQADIALSLRENEQRTGRARRGDLRAVRRESAGSLPALKLRSWPPSTPGDAPRSAALAHPRSRSPSTWRSEGRLAGDTGSGFHAPGRDPT